MLKINFKQASSRPIRTIEREMEATRARYKTYRETGKIIHEAPKRIKQSPITSIYKFIKSLINANK